MCIDFEGHHSGGSSFVNENDFFYYRNCLYNHRYKFSSEKKNKSVSPNSVQYSVAPRTRFGSAIQVGSGSGGRHISFMSQHKLSCSQLTCICFSYSLP